jgi:hypothetical protein
MPQVQEQYVSLVVVVVSVLGRDAIKQASLSDCSGGAHTFDWSIQWDHPLSNPFQATNQHQSLMV